jgi:leucyl aminopeptidase
VVILKSSQQSSSETIALGLATKDGKLIVEVGDSGLNAKSFLPALEEVGATGAAEEVIKVPITAPAHHRLIIFTGLGEAAKNSEYPHEVLRRAAGVAVRALAGKTSADFALPHKTPQNFAAIAEGIALGAYSFDQHRGSSKANQKKPLGSATIISHLREDPSLKSTLKRATILAKYVHLVRDLVNTPANHLSPSTFVARIKSIATSLTVKIEVLDEKALKAKGYGGIYSVGQGSANPPRLLHISYSPAKAKKRFAFVGKGITFDTGGYALKPAIGMDAMKSDMAGAASVVAATLAIAELKLPVSIHAYACLAENMVSGNATRPGDVITTLSGKTVEVLNPDAEGRLVMADGLTRAVRDAEKTGGLDGLIDVATLTSAQVIALGTRTAGLMSNNEIFTQEFLKVAHSAGELFWPMPLPEELRATLDTPVADIANVGDNNGKMLVAGLFLQEFVPPTTPWLHLDIAGPAYSEKVEHGYCTVGGTGITVRSLVALAESAGSHSTL